MTVIRSERRRVAGRVASILILCLFAILVQAPSVSAHAELEQTVPAPGSVVPVRPEFLELIFNEPVEPVDRQFRLFDSSESFVTIEPETSGTTVRIPMSADMANGSYVLAWRVISADGHPISGALAFAVGTESQGTIEVTFAETDPWVEWLLGIAQALGYASLLTVVGLLFFRQVVEQADRLFDGWVVALGTTAAVSFALTVPLTVARQQARTPGYLLDVSEWAGDVRTDSVLLVCVVLAGLAMLAIAARMRRFRYRTGILAVGALLALGALSIVGHTRIVDPEWLIVLSNVSHTIAGAVWLGGLVGLALAFRSERRDLTRLSNVIARFSGTAAIALGMVITTGSVSAFLILRTFDALVHTSYGQLLIVKIGLVVLVCLIAVWNRFRLVPAIDAQPTEPDRFDKLRKLVTAEVILLLAVATLTGFLVNLSPREAISAEAPAMHSHHEPIELTIAMGETTISGEFMYMDGETHHLQFVVMGKDGLVIVPQETPSLTLTLERLDLGPLPITLTASADGSIFSGTVDFPFTGEWTVTASVRLSTFESANGFGTIVIP